MFAEQGNKDPQAVNEAVDTVLGEIVAANARGEQAVDYFKLDPEQLASDMLAQIGPDKKHGLLLALIGGALVYAFMIFASNGFKPLHSWFQSVIIFLMYIAMFGYAIFSRSLMARLFPNKTPQIRRKYAYLSILFVGILLIVIIFVLYKITGRNI